MKKKIYKFVSVTVIAVAMVVSFQISKANGATTLTLENVEALAMADGEGSGSTKYDTMKYIGNVLTNCCADKYNHGCQFSTNCPD